METAVAENYATNPAFAQGGNLDIPAFGGPLGIRWDESARATPWGGLAYFATFLRTSGLFDRLVADAPFAYASPNAPDVRNVVGTAVLAILAGLTRHCHVERLRRDAACAALLGLTKVVSDESLRRGLKRCDEARLQPAEARPAEPQLPHGLHRDAQDRRHGGRAARQDALRRGCSGRAVWAVETTESWLGEFFNRGI